MPPQGSAIDVRLARDGPTSPSAVGDVATHDLGIPAADQPHIDAGFLRAGHVVEHMPGTGIGLASVRQIVEQ